MTTQAGPVPDGFLAGTGEMANPIRGPVSIGHRAAADRHRAEEPANGRQPVFFAF